MNNEQMLAELLLANIVSIFSRDFTFNPGTQYQFDVEEGIVLEVNANDVFYWGCADSEYFGEDEIASIYAEWKKDPNFGIFKWLCKKRNMRPQVPLVEQIKKAGLWDAEFDALPAPRPS